MKKSVIVVSLALNLFLATQTNFVWNDTDESIPREGSEVLIDFVEGNTVYLVPVDPHYNLEVYDNQFKVVDPETNVCIFEGDYNSDIGKALLKFNE